MTYLMPKAYPSENDKKSLQFWLLHAIHNRIATTTSKGALVPFFLLFCEGRTTEGVREVSIIYNKREKMPSTIAATKVQGHSQTAFFERANRYRGLMAPTNVPPEVL